MEKTLFEAMKNLFSTIENHSEGKTVPKLYNNITIEFDVTDGKSFHGLIQDGKFKFEEGTVPDSLSVSHWVADEKTFWRMINGDIRPIQAIWDGEMYVPDAYGMRPILHWTVRLFRIAFESKLPRGLQTTGSRLGLESFSK
jgi:putative sterol carrier protein